MAPVPLIILAVLALEAIEAAVETKTEVMDSVNLETNSVGPADTYDLYKQMMEIKQHLLSNSSSSRDKPDSEPEILTKLKNALSLLYDAILDGLLYGFLPNFEKQRREAREGDKSYLDVLVLIIGALLGKQSCTNMMACRLASLISQSTVAKSLVFQDREVCWVQCSQCWIDDHHARKYHSFLHFKPFWNR